MWTQGKQAMCRTCGGLGVGVGGGCFPLGCCQVHSPSPLLGLDSSSQERICRGRINVAEQTSGEDHLYSVDLKTNKDSCNVKLRVKELKTCGGRYASEISSHLVCVKKI